jgi:transcriptional regulator with XRE-family HTH domain
VNTDGRSDRSWADDLGRQLRRLRIRAGLSGRDLAERLGTSQPRISRIETGEARPPIAVVTAWCDATDASARTRLRLLELAEDELVGHREDHDGSADAVRLSRLLFEARESLQMWADSVESRSGQPDHYTRALVRQIDEFRAERGWSPQGFGGES